MKAFFPGWVLVVVLAVAPWLRAADPEIRVTSDIAYLAPDRKEKLDLYLPTPPAEGKLSPAIVWIHGGGWAGGTKSEARAKNICGILARAGYVAVSVDYRLGEGAWPTNLFDCKNAVRYLRAHAAEYHLDPERIGVAGGSAGGHLALMVGLTAGKPGLEPEGAATPYPQYSSAVRCIIDMYGITNILTRQEVDKAGHPQGVRKAASALKYFNAKSTEDEVLRTASPVNHISRTSPPVLILHGHADATVDYPQAEELAAALKTKGVEHQLVLLDRVGHTFDFQTWNKKPLPQDVRAIALDFLGRHLK
jgi:acetyl esterase/lipase